MDKYIFYDESNSNLNDMRVVGSCSIPMVTYDYKAKVHSYQDKPIFKYSFSDIVDDPFKIQKNENVTLSIDQITDDYVDWAISMIQDYSTTVKTSMLIYDKLYTVADKLKGDKDYLVYKKLPERIIYSLLKHDINLYRSNINIYMDYSKKYEEMQTQIYLKEHLNALSLYRNYSYHVNSVALIDKKFQNHIIDDLNINKVNLEESIDYYKDQIHKNNTDIDHFTTLKSSLTTYQQRQKDIRKQISSIENKLDNNQLLSQYDKLVKEKESLIEESKTNKLKIKEIIEQYDPINNYKKSKVQLSHATLQLEYKKISHNHYIFGLSLIDLLLNIVRVIVQHNQYIHTIAGLSTKLQRRVNIINRILDGVKHTNFLDNVTLLEWNGSATMRKIDFIEQYKTYKSLNGDSHDQ